MRKNKKKLLASIAGLTVLGSIVGNYLIKEEGTLLPPPTLNQSLAVYIEDENNETGYSKSDSTQFPTEGYILNIEKSTCTNGGVLNQDTSTKKISLSVEHKSSCSLYFDKEVNNESTPTLVKLGKSVKKGTPTFAEPATTDETADGLYSMEDNYGTSYYYRGAVEDNYVKFAGFYWRIIRINGDGSLRIIYDGTQTHANGANSTDRLSGTIADWNTTNYNDNKYVGYMYGGANGTGSTSKSGAQTNQTNTSMKNRLERWYKSNIVDKGYDEDVSDNIFCNDRTTPGKSETGWQDDTGLGYGTRITVYGAVSRLYHYGANGYESIPNFTCENNNDAFTKEDTEKGNGKLGEKVGLITADEIVVAGSGFENKKNSNYYLYKGSRYWSFSPYYYSAFARMYVVNDNGDLSRLPVHNNIGFAPVINLSAEYVSTMSGNGTMESPFEA